MATTEQLLEKYRDSLVADLYELFNKYDELYAAELDAGEIPPDPALGVFINSIYALREFGFETSDLVELLEAHAAQVPDNEEEASE